MATFREPAISGVGAVGELPAGSVTTGELAADGDAEVEGVGETAERVVEELLAAGLLAGVVVTAGDATAGMLD